MNAFAPFVETNAVTKGSHLTPIELRHHSFVLAHPVSAMLHLLKRHHNRPKEGCSSLMKPLACVTLMQIGEVAPPTEAIMRHNCAGAFGRAP